MKKVFIILIISIAFLSCKKEGNSQENDAAQAIEANSLKTIKGDFIYYADAAVLQTRSEIYGVVIDDKMHELNELVKKYKTKDTDMIPVEVKGHLIPKPEGKEGWPFKIEIKDILNIYKPNPNNNDVIQVGDK